MKPLLAVLSAAILLVGIQTTSASNNTEASAHEVTTSKKTHWLTTSSGIRHNSGCRWYKNSKGRSCTKSEGRACKKCKG